MCQTIMLSCYTFLGGSVRLLGGAGKDGAAMGMLDIHATLVVDQVDLWFWLIVLKTLFAVRRFENGDDGNSKAGPTPRTTGLTK